MAAARGNQFSTFKELGGPAACFDVCRGLARCVVAQFVRKFLTCYLVLGSEATREQRVRVHMHTAVGKEAVGFACMSHGSVALVNALGLEITPPPERLGPTDHDTLEEPTMVIPTGAATHSTTRHAIHVSHLSPTASTTGADADITDGDAKEAAGVRVKVVVVPAKDTSASGGGPAYSLSGELAVFMALAVVILVAACVIYIGGKGRQRHQHTGAGKHTSTPGQANARGPWAAPVAGYDVNSATCTNMQSSRLRTQASTSSAKSHIDAGDELTEESSTEPECTSTVAEDEVSADTGADMYLTCTDSASNTQHARDAQQYHQHQQHQQQHQQHQHQHQHQQHQHVLSESEAASKPHMNSTPLCQNGAKNLESRICNIEV